MSRRTVPSHAPDVHGGTEGFGEALEREYHDRVPVIFDASIGQRFASQKMAEDRIVPDFVEYAVGVNDLRTIVYPRRNLSRRNGSSHPRPPKGNDQRYHLRELADQYYFLNQAVGAR